MEEYGFDDTDTINLRNCENDNGNKYNDNHLIQFDIGHKDISQYSSGNNVPKTNLLAVFVRGTHGTEEWYSNFDIGNTDEWHNGTDWRTKENHMGFDIAAVRAKKEIDTYLSSHDLNKDNTVIWLAGHSRGAAVSGIIATYLIADGYKVFAYNFATPNQVETYNKSDIVTPGVFNLVNTDDLIPQLPLKNTWNFYKYGYTIPMNFSPNMERVWHTRVSFWYNQTSQYMIDSVLQSFSNMCSERNKCYYFDENDNSMIKKYDIIDYLPAYNFYNNLPPHIKETIEISYEDGFFIVKQKPIYFMQVLAGVAAEDKHFNKYTFGLLQFYNAPKYNDANISMTVISMLGMKNPHFVDSYIILCEKAG